MKSSILRGPVIKSAALLAVVSLLVYLTATSVEGTIWSSLATLFVATFRGVQLGLGLIVSVFFCLALLTGIFLGCVAMVSRESAAKMFDRLRQQISDRLLYVRGLVIRDTPAKQVQTGPVGRDSHLNDERLEAVEGVIGVMREDHASATAKIESLLLRLDAIDQDREVESRLDIQDEQIQGLTAQVQHLSDQLATLQGMVEELSSHSGND